MTVDSCPNPSHLGILSVLFITISKTDLSEYGTGDFMKKVPSATCALRDRWIVSIEQVYTTSTFYMKSAVSKDGRKSIYSIGVYM